MTGVARDIETAGSPIRLVLVIGPQVEAKIGAAEAEVDWLPAEWSIDDDKKDSLSLPEVPLALEVPPPTRWEPDSKHELS